ncbi:hypothetical protein M3Y94_01109900 [Aphelenchoides besseyi]|nr:hypothetical protein M3Y94_01109900 [Aphelenchoides besseyi]
MECCIIVMHFSSTLTMKKSWPKLNRTAYEIAHKYEPTACDSSGVDFAFDYNKTTGEIGALRIIHVSSGYSQILDILELPIYQRIGLISKKFPAGTQFNYEKASYVIHEDVLGWSCQYDTDVLVGAMFLDTKTPVIECMMRIFDTNHTPVAIGFIKEDSVFSRSLDDVLNPTFWKKVEKLFKNFYLKYWHLFWLPCTIAVLLIVPMIILFGRVYHQMIVSAARFNIALDALIATNCDVFQHIRERQNLLNDSGFESISLNDVNVDDDQLRVKAEMLHKIWYGKRSSPAIEHQQPQTRASKQVAKN